ncbi:MAG TPA: polysaccharide biosynthesis protein [Rhodanobacteraceae bacterium]|nr:polysaccharide biosynthesis protein [Rhodanobacteraceae bacterium]
MNARSEPADPNHPESRAIGRHIEPQALSIVALESRKLIHRDDSSRRYADVFREVRTRLLALGGGQNFVTMVTAVSPQSGASFVARNLAAAFAFGEHMSALLLDCNLRNPSQAKAFDVPPDQGGLIDYLEDPHRTIEDVVRRTGIPRLQLLPAGRSMELVGEQFSSLRMRTMIDSLRGRYHDRYLILDAPAIKNAPDARILSDLADFVVVVAGYGRDTPAAIAEAAGSFDPQKLAGVVFNHNP